MVKVWSSFLKLAVPTIDKLKADRSQFIEERNTLNDEYKKIAAELKELDYIKLQDLMNAPSRER